MNKVYISRIDPTQYTKDEFYSATLKRCYCVGKIYEDGIFISSDDSGIVRIELNLVDLFPNPLGRSFALIIKTDTQIYIFPKTVYLGCVIGDSGYTAAFESFPTRDCNKIPIPYNVIGVGELGFNLSCQQLDELNITNLNSTKSNPKPITFNVAIIIDKLLQDVNKWLEEKSHHATLSMLEQFAKETLQFKISIKDETNPQSDTAQSVRQKKVE